MITKLGITCRTGVAEAARSTQMSGCSRMQTARMMAKT